MRRKILLSLLISILILIIGKASYATVEIVPSKSGDGKDAIVNVSVSDSFILSRGMKTNTGESLKGSNVDVHLATNKDWGAVSYLSHSIYGTNKTGGVNGITQTINGVSYYSTTTNITGVMNWGSNPNINRNSFTAGLADVCTSGYDNITELYNNRTTKYVEYTDFNNAANSKGMAMQETNNKVFSRGAYCYTNSRIDAPVTFRTNLFSGWSDSKGVMGNSTTFRPVIWN